IGQAEATAHEKPTKAETYPCRQRYNRRTKAKGEPTSHGKLPHPTNPPQPANKRRTSDPQHPSTFCINSSHGIALINPPQRLFKSRNPVVVPEIEKLGPSLEPIKGFELHHFKHSAPREQPVTKNGLISS
ncbi:hypothetical protein Ancab_008119, partial [Ancistrocladus abbreviatus]